MGCKLDVRQKSTHKHVCMCHFFVSEETEHKEESKHMQN